MFTYFYVLFPLVYFVTEWSRISNTIFFSPSFPLHIACSRSSEMRCVPFGPRVSCVEATARYLIVFVVELSRCAVSPLVRECHARRRRRGSLLYFLAIGVSYIAPLSVAGGGGVELYSYVLLGF